jgi:hypothetical protein
MGLSFYYPQAFSDNGVSILLFLRLRVSVAYIAFEGLSAYIRKTFCTTFTAAHRFHTKALLW